MEYTITTSPTQTPLLMAADFTARPVQFLFNSLFIFLGAVLLGCTEPQEKIDSVMLNSTKSNFEQLNGTVLLDNEPFTGSIYTLFPDTQDTTRIVRYLMGKEHAIWKQFYPAGRLLDQREFSRGLKVGDLVAWWENGKKKLHYRFENDEYEGTCREWNEDGTLVQEMNYRRGHEEGSQKMFYDNGKVRSNYLVRDGRRYGLLGTKNCVNVSGSVFIR
jgi:antitoxin component YwqK of YwqJK toxin-antitoxin module